MDHNEPLGNQGPDALFWSSDRRPPLSADCNVKHLTGSIRRLLWPLVSYLLGAACLFWVIHDVQLKPLLSSMAGINWEWAALTILLDLLTYLCAAVRWQVLLRPIGKLRIGRATRAYYAGLFANDVFPAHLGNVVRVYLASRWLDKDLVSVIPSLLIERLCESLLVVLAFGIMALLIPLPGGFLRVGETLGILLLLGTALAVFLVLRRSQGGGRMASASWHKWKVVRKTKAFIGRVVDGIRDIGRAGLLVPVLWLSFLKLLMQTLAFSTMIEAYGLRVSVWAGVAVFLITRVGTVVPSTPAAVGAFQLFCVAGLKLFGVGKTEATGFALVAFFVLTVPLWIVGFICLAQSGVTLRLIRGGVGNSRLREKPS